MRKFCNKDPVSFVDTPKCTLVLRAKRFRAQDIMSAIVGIITPSNKSVNFRTATEDS